MMDEECFIIIKFVATILSSIKVKNIYFKNNFTVFQSNTWILMDEDYFNNNSKIIIKVNAFYFLLKNWCCKFYYINDCVIF